MRRVPTAPPRAPKRIGLQLGLLAGLGLAVVLGSAPERATAGGAPECPYEGQCTFKKPNFLFILDYSTAMNADFDGQQTRWEAALAAVEQAVEPGGFVSQNSRLALMRYGHDPDPLTAGTSIPGEGTGLVDGQAFDLRWDDAQGEYLACNGQALLDALAATPAPMQGQATGIEAWTRGALDAATLEIAQTKADHPEDEIGQPRVYANIVLTAGEWTAADGSSSLAPPEDDPAIPAAALFDEQDIVTYVLSLAGEPSFAAEADALAAAGGSVEAIPGASPEILVEVLWNHIYTLIDGLFAPDCVGGLPRVMVLVDASSAMLNEADQATFAAQGESPWDQARAALVGAEGLFEATTIHGSLEDLAHLGLAVYGHDKPDLGEQQVLAQYGPCMRDNFEWALDPGTAAGCASTPACVWDSGCEADQVCVDGHCEQSCELDQDCPQGLCLAGSCGCSTSDDCGAGECIHGRCRSCEFDPWQGPPIAWTFADGSLSDPPGFDLPTRNHMPRCQGTQACLGSGAFVHLGLELVKDNQASYLAAAMVPDALYPANPSTVFANILVTRGRYDGYSTDAQVQAELEAMYAAGITTYVIAFGEGIDDPLALAQLEAMVGWGSGGQLGPFDADTQAALAAALVEVFESIEYDPCCAFLDCSMTPEPTTAEPDPLPPPEDDGESTGGEDSTGSDSGGGTTSETGAETDTDTSSEGSDESESSGADEIGTDEAGADEGPVAEEGCACTLDGQGPAPVAGLALLALGLGLRRRRS